MEIYVVFLVAILSYLIFGAGYRLYFSPISHFPGPRLAALTFWYEFYYDVVLKGQYVWKIKSLHKKYGPIIRISPYELHVSDPEFHDQVYSGPARRTNKFFWSARMFGTDKAVVGTVSHEEHRARRGALNPYFSKRAIVEIEPIIQASVNTLIGRLKASTEPVNLIDAFSSLSVDIVSCYLYGSSYNFLETDDFNPTWHHFMMDLSRNSHLMKQFHWVYNVIMSVPRSLQNLVLHLHPLLRQLLALRTTISSQITSAQRQLKDSEKLQPTHSTLLHQLLKDINRSGKDLSNAHLTDELLTIIAAGTMTTAWALIITVFHLLSCPTKLAKLRHELSQSDGPSSDIVELDQYPEHYAPQTGNLRPTWQQLEQLPYLSACILEGLRLSYGTSHRLARVSPDQPLVFRHWVIPPAIPVSMTQMMIHQDSNIFFSPDQFLPERWLHVDKGGRSTMEELRKMKRFLVPFSKGTRACLGRELAYAELYLGLAALFGVDGVDLELWETDQTDVDVKHDFFSPSPKLDSEGVRVLVK